MINKRGQAFLISTVILIGVLITFITISNYSKKTNFSTFYYTADDIQTESEKVIDYSLVNDDPLVIDKFTKNVSKYVDDDTKIYFITGEDTNIEAYTYDINGKLMLNAEIINEKIVLKIDNTNYSFDLTEGKHFYFIMIKKFKGDKYVYTNA